MKAVESKTPILVLSHHNCELLCCHLDGYKSNTQALLERLTKIEAELFKKPSHSKFRLWYNLDENKLDQDTIKLIVKSIFLFRKNIYKIAFIGLHGIVKWKFNCELTKTLKETTVPLAYFLDAEQAKGWLI